MSLSHLASPTDAVGYQLNPNFNSLLVHTVSSLNTLGSSAGAGVSSLWMPPASAPASLTATPTAALTQYDEQKLTNQAFTGGLGTGNCTVYLRKIGKMAFVQISAVSAPSATAATWVLTPTLPASYFPANGTSTTGPVNVITNGAAAPGNVNINAAGTVVVGPITSSSGLPIIGNFTNAAAGGFNTFTVCYPTDV